MNEYTNEIIKKILNLQHAFREEQNMDNPYYEKYMEDLGIHDAAVAAMAENVNFINNYLHDKVIELAIAVCNSDWYGVSIGEDGQIESTDTIIKKFEEFMHTRIKKEVE